MPAGSGGRRGNRTTLTVLAVAGFAAAIGLAGAGSVGAQRRGGSVAADTVVTTVAVLVGIAALGFAAFVARRTGRPPPSGGDTTLTVPAFLLQPVIAPLIATILMLLFSALVIGPCLSNQRSSSDRPPLRPDRPGTTAVPPASSTRSADNRPNWSVVTGLVLGATGLALAVVAARNRRGSEPEPEADLDDEIERSLADLDSLEQDPDHRRVVIRTYARMERALGQIGVARDPSESSQEFLQRALAHLGARAGAARQLTDLFEQARFSTHPVDEAMRAQAATSLRTVRDEIASAVASSGTTT